MKFKHLLLLLVLWQVAAIFSLSLGSVVLPLQKTFLGGGSKFYVLNPYLYSRGNFDGYHYVHIATWGYGYAEQAFFPLYPNLIRVLSTYVKSPYLVGVEISLVSVVIALVLLEKLLSLDYKSKTVFWIICSLLVFPASFYFGSVYTESLFFMFTVASFYLARKGNWFLAAVLGGLAAYTRLVGIFLFPALIAEWWVQNNYQLKSWSRGIKLVYLLIIPLGLATYMGYLQIHGGDSLAFIHVQPSFGNYRSTSLVMPYQVFWRYARMILTVQKGTLLYSNVIYEFAIGLLFFVFSIVAFFKLRLSYAIFASLAYITPTLTGSFVSVPRYVLICFPGFILLGKILEKNPIIRYLYLIVSGITFILLTALFSRGYWIS